jgi:hypothetical protein
MTGDGCAKRHCIILYIREEFEFQQFSEDPVLVIRDGRSFKISVSCTYMHRQLGLPFVWFYVYTYGYVMQRQDKSVVDL